LPPLGDDPKCYVLAIETLQPNSNPALSINGHIRDGWMWMDGWLVDMGNGHAEALAADLWLK